MPSHESVHVSRDGFIKARRATWRERLLFNCWRRPFPYLFHRWTVEDRDMGYCTSTVRLTSARAWLAEWDRLSGWEDEARASR